MVEVRPAGRMAAPEAAVLPQTPSATHYLVAGLRLESEVELPSLQLLPRSGEAPDVVLRVTTVPGQLACAEDGGADWQVRGDHFLLHAPGVGRFLVRGGSAVDVDPQDGVDAGDLALYVLGTCLAILLQQRGATVLHASAVAVGGRAVLFCGPSGAGKSTLAAMLCQRGYPLLNDDTCSLISDSNGTLAAAGDGRMLKLWAQSVDSLLLASEDARPVRRDVDKFYLSPARYDLRTRPVGAIYFLADSDPDSRPAVIPLPAVDAATRLRENAYRPALVRAMGRESTFFVTSAQLMRQAVISVLLRPRQFACRETLMDVLEEHWSSFLPGIVQERSVQEAE